MRHRGGVRDRVSALRIARARFIHKLRERSTGIAVHFTQLNLQPFSREAFGCQGDLREAERVYEHTVSLPIFSDMREGDVDDVLETVSSPRFGARG